MDEDKAASEEAAEYAVTVHLLADVSQLNPETGATLTQQLAKLIARSPNRFPAQRSLTPTPQPSAVQTAPRKDDSWPGSQTFSNVQVEVATQLAPPVATEADSEPKPELSPERIAELERRADEKTDRALSRTARAIP